jgi:hypothetical protein
MVVGALTAMPFAVLAQGPGFGGGVNDGGVCVPLDGGLTLMAAAGIGYTVKKVLKK